MDDITIAMVAALILKERHGAVSVSLQEDYTRLREAIIQTVDNEQAIVKALEALEANPTSAVRQRVLHEELIAVQSHENEALRQLAGSLNEQVFLHRKGERILRHVTRYFRNGKDILFDIFFPGMLLDYVSDFLRFPRAQARPPGDPTILPRPPKGSASKSGTDSESDPHQGGS